MIAAKPGLNDLALTTNGVLLADQIDALKAAGLGRITVSLDTLHRDRFQALTRFDQLDAVHAGIAAAHRVFGRLKIDTVVIRGVNDDELVELIEYGRVGQRRSAVHRIHGRRRRDAAGRRERVVSRREMLETLSAHYGADRCRSTNRDRRRRPSASPCRTARPSASSRRRREPFCRTCDRSRLTADGMWYLCLYATRGLDLRAPLRARRGRRGAARR